MKFLPLLMISAVFAATIDRAEESLEELAEGRVETSHWSRSTYVDTVLVEIG